jgi:hypothetical protein
VSRCAACRCEHGFARTVGVEPPEPGEDLYAYAWCMGAAFVIGSVLAARRQPDGGTQLEIPLCDLHRKELDELLDDHTMIERALRETAPAPTRETEPS